MAEDKTETKTSDKPKEVDGRAIMRVKVYSPYRSYIDEDAYSITAVNETGPFDILPRHHNFLSILLPCELLIDTPEGERRVRISKGIMHVRAEKVTVFLDI